MKRGIGLTVVGALLAWLSLGGFAVATWASVIDSRWWFRGPTLLVGVLYGVSALLSGIGILAMRTWALAPLKLWAAATIAVVWLPRLSAKIDYPIWQTVLGSLLVAAFCIAVYHYVARRMVRPAA